jgi:hypothetical protein
MSNPSLRTADHPIHPMFLERWSPRVFAPEPITEPELMSILEAARWAPSSFNAQPWLGRGSPISLRYEIRRG